MSDDLRIETLGHDSLAVSQDRTENGTGVTPPKGVITRPYHLPECQLATSVYDDRADCICDELRACEQRVRMESQAWHYRTGYNSGFADALDAAETTVAASWSWPDWADDGKGEQEVMLVGDAISAIRSLKKEP